MSTAVQIPRGERCPYAKKCGGCQMQNLRYEDQLRWKQAQVQRQIGRFCRVQPILGMENPLHYRCKVQAAFAPVHGRTVSGIYQSSSHVLVPVDHCRIEDEGAQRIIADVRRLMPKFRVTPFDEDARRGVLRHVLVRRGWATGQYLAAIVSFTPVFPSKRRFAEALVRLHPELTTVVLNVNRQRTSMVLGSEEHVLYGPGFIEDELCGLRFRISASSFYQVNPPQAERLYRAAIDMAQLTGQESVLDAYCGVGTIGLAAASQAGRVTGVELNPAAARDASGNARRNNVRNARFFAGDAGEFLRDAAAGGEPFDVVLMDPPRAGASREFLEAVCAAAPRRVVYISCNPETQARDLRFLTSHGYRAERAQPVDMFPFTHHIETVCLLSKLNAKQHIEINLDMDELDLTDAEKKATYQEIKDYVLEHSGLKISSLYIAQVKQKCGIIERDNYNKPKSEDAKQPQCPPDKEKAIKEALKHFGMI